MYNADNGGGGHAAYVGSWLKTLQNDRHEIFHAAHDAHRAADLLIALEFHKSLDQALAHFNEPHAFMVHQPISDSAQILHSNDGAFQVSIGNGSLRSHVSHERPLPAVFPFRFPHTMPHQKLVLAVFRGYQPAKATGQNREIGLKASRECQTRDEHCGTIASTRLRSSDYHARLEGRISATVGRLYHP